MDPELLKQHRIQRLESVQDAMKKVIDEEELVIKYANVKAENNELKKIQDKLSKDVQTLNQVVQKM